MNTTLTQMEQWIDERVTDPLHPEYSLLYAQVEFWPGVREGGALEEYYIIIKNRVGSVGDRLRDWVLKQFGVSARLADWETIPSPRQLRAESQYEDEF
ncbi:hypothetical protein [Acaryochloris marina]|uniref:Uncharacterized protein n=1 Tax=Acaryochloris marina (strain MBIC 11017) TaxID=329726 RepID=A8ZK20_ACAM1|nr:hypothetical protein [Acaryochloris marina]ABW31520.1 hypothetical protein AM1_A0011 [Acaryochloris marina MBIC11017]